MTNKELDQIKAFLALASNRMQPLEAVHAFGLLTPNLEGMTQPEARLMLEHALVGIIRKYLDNYSQSFTCPLCRLRGRGDYPMHMDGPEEYLVCSNCGLEVDADDYNLLSERLV
jgi:hypothetical protein